jgi:hypothetical protein
MYTLPVMMILLRALQISLKIDVEKILYDNVGFTEGLTKKKNFFPFSPVAVPIEWKG